MAQLFSNNASTTLSAGITNSATSISVTDGSVFSDPNSVAEDFELLTIDDGVNIEIVKVTDRTTNTLTVIRGVEGTTASAFSSGATIESRVTKGTLETLLQDNYVRSASSTTGSTLSIGRITGGYSLFASSVLIGHGQTTSDAETDSNVCVGYLADSTAAGGNNNVTIGREAVSGGSYCNSIGSLVSNPNSKTNVIGGTSKISRSNRLLTAGYEMYFLAGNEAVIMSGDKNLKTLADDVVSITIPTNTRFYINEVGVIVTAAISVTVQPNVSFGITGNTVAILASTATTGSTQFSRDRFTSPLLSGGQTSLTASVKSAATATTMNGRFYWKGMLVENE